MDVYLITMVRSLLRQIPSSLSTFQPRRHRIFPRLTAKVFPNIPRDSVFDVLVFVGGSFLLLLRRIETNQG